MSNFHLWRETRSRLCAAMSGSNVNKVFYADNYHPIQAGSIDGTDILSHDNAVYRALLCSSAGLCNSLPSKFSTPTLYLLMFFAVFFILIYWCDLFWQMTPMAIPRSSVTLIAPSSLVAFHISLLKTLFAGYFLFINQFFLWFILFLIRIEMN